MNFVRDFRIIITSILLIQAAFSQAQKTAIATQTGVSTTRTNRDTLSLATENVMIFDYDRKDLFLFKRKGRENIAINKKRRIRPTVGRNTNVSFINYNPLNDSIVFTTIYYNRNTEQGSTLQNLLNQSMGTATATTKNQENVAEEKVVASAGTLDSIKSLRSFLQKHYSFLKAQPSFSIDELTKSNQAIANDIKRKFKINDVFELIILKDGESSLDEKQQKQLEQLIDDILNLWRKLNTYNVLAFNPHQTPNVDEVEYKFEFY